MAADLRPSFAASHPVPGSTLPTPGANEPEGYLPNEPENPHKRWAAALNEPANEPEPGPA